MNRRRTDRDASLYFVLFLSAVLWIFALPGCADPIAAARNAVATAATVQKDTVEQFTAWDSMHQLEIVDAAANAEEANKALAEYRAKRKPAMTAMRSLWLATVTTKAAIALAESGKKDPKDLAGYVTALLQNVNQVVQAFGMLGMPLPGAGGE